MGNYTNFFEDMSYDIFEKDDFYEELKNIVSHFRTFDKALDTFIIEHGFDGNIQNSEEKILFIKNKFNKEEVPVPRNIKKWYSEHIGIERTTAFQICMVFRLTVDEVNDFLRRICLDRGFDCHSIEDVVYYFAIKKRLPYKEVKAIFSQIKKIKQEKIAREDMVYTSAIVEEIDNIETVEELITYLNENADKFEYNNVKACEEIRIIWEKLSKSDGIAIREKKNLYKTFDKEISEKEDNERRKIRKRQENSIFEIYLQILGLAGTYMAPMKWEKLYHPKLYKELTIFFQNTLQSFYADRYQQMKDAMEQLEIIEKYADFSVPFIYAGCVENSGTVIGREQECDWIKNWCNTEQKLLFVTGMGGIGKSTIVRKFAKDNKEQFDHMIYLQYHGNICETIVDDTQFCINGYEKNKEETIKEYFDRKIKVVKELTKDTNSLLIVDNFDGVFDESFQELLQVNWKIIVITRFDRKETGYDCLHIAQLHEKNELYSLFEHNMGKKLKKEEYPKLDHMIEMVGGHTLALVLIAKQISKSFIDIEEAVKLAEENGFSEIGSEKIRYMKDGTEKYDKISAILKAVYDVTGLSEEKKKCMKILSVFDIPGIDIKMAGNILKLENLDDLNELVDFGWLEISDCNVQMHPLIQDLIHQMEWSEEYRKIILEEMRNLFKNIKLNGKCEEYPKKMYLQNMKIKKKMEQSDFTKKLIYKMMQKKGVTGEIALERILREDGVQDYRQLQRTMELSKSVLLHCGKDKILSNETIYKDLLFVTLINSPKEHEEYVVNNCEKLFRGTDCKNPYAIMELYDYVVYLQCQKGSYDEAKKYLERANRFAKCQKKHYIWGLYYDMLTDFYEEILDGAYDTEDEEKLQLLQKMFCAMDKAIYHMGKSKHENAKNLYAKYVLSKVALMIRSTPKKSEKIKSLISGTKSIIEKYTLDYAEVRFVYYMVWAWYHTLCEVEESLVLQNLKVAAEIAETRNLSEFEKIDDFYIPAANMMYELGNARMALEFLEEACNICDKHTNFVPYTRKKQNLLEYKLEVTQRTR